MDGSQTYSPRRKAHFIAGEWRQTQGATFPDRNPLNDELLEEIAAGGRDEAMAAVEAAAAAFPAWSEMPPARRQALFLRAADIIERRAEEVIRLLAVEAGTSRVFSELQVRLSAAQMRQAANWGYLPQGDVMHSDIANRTATVTRKPLGVVAGFTPWNGAFYLGWRTITLPMAFGNTVVIKPSEAAPISAGLIQADILHEAGFPPGTVNVVTHAPGEAKPIADVFFEHAAVRCINFTGSDRTARILGEQAGRNLKRMVLELGGFNPMIVLDDANLDAAVQAATFGAFLHQGQVCMNTRKIHVARNLHDAFVEKLAAGAAKLKSGDPTDGSVMIGPLIDDAAVKRTRTRIEDAVSRGARLVIGGTAEGRIFAPTILCDVPDDAVCTTGCDETFGPLLVVEAFDDADDAVARSQAGPYGLSASVWTRNHARGMAIARRFDAGMIHVNGATMASEASLPNGGVKNSGWGRSGYYAVEDFTELKLTTVTDLGEGAL